MLQMSRYLVQNQAGPVQAISYCVLSEMRGLRSAVLVSLLLKLSRSLGLLSGLRTHMEKSGASQTERPLDNLLPGIPFGLSKGVYQNH